MADRSPWQQRGRQPEQSMGSPIQRVQSSQPVGRELQRAESPSSLRAPSAGYSFLRHLGEMRRLAPAPAPAPTPAPVPEMQPEPIVGPSRFEYPSVKLPPIRRMAPQRGTTGRPAREEPILRPPQPSDRRPSRLDNSEKANAFVTTQASLLPLYLSLPVGEQDAMLERLLPRPRDITFLPPMTPYNPPSNVTSPNKDVFSDIAPPTPAKDGQHGFGPSPYALNVPATPTQFTLPVAPIAPMFDGGLPPPTPTKVIVDPSAPTYFEGPVYDTLYPLPKPVEPRINMGPVNPFSKLRPNISPDKPLPQLPPAGYFSRPPPHTTFRDIRPHEYRPNPSLPRGVLLDPRPYRPKTPPPSFFLSQGQVNAACRSASLPELPKFGDEPFAKRSLAIKDYNPQPTKEDKEARKCALDPVKFVDYTKIAELRYTKFPKGPGNSSFKEYVGEPPKSFGPAEAKILMLKLLPAVSLSSITYYLRTI
jgi:hypothetical protein